MSNFNDLHHISDISNIHCSSKLQKAISGVNLSHSLVDHFSNAIQSNNKSTIIERTNAIEKVTRSLALCEETISERIKANIIYQCIKEATLNGKNTLLKSTVEKLQALLLVHKLNKYIHLPLPPPPNHSQDELILLDIMDLPLSDLNTAEKLDAKCYVETILREKIHDAMLKYNALGGNMKETQKTKSDTRNKLLECCEATALSVEIQWKNKIEELNMQYETNLAKYINLMDKWNKLKYEDTSLAYLEKAEHLLLQAQVAELQAKITKFSCITRVFNETPTTTTAFKILNKVVDEKMHLVMDEIRQKEDLKRLYDSLKNTEYDEVLKNYLQLCSMIKKKKHILEML